VLLQNLVQLRCKASHGICL